MTDTKKNTGTTSTIEQADDAINNYVFPFAPREIGVVTSVSTGIVKVSGLPNVGFEELLQFPNGLFGIAYNIDEDEIGVILLGKDSLLTAGAIYSRPGELFPSATTTVVYSIAPFSSRLAITFATAAARWPMAQ